MDTEILSVFDHELQMNKKLLLHAGVWPFASPIMNASKRMLIGIFLLVMSVPNANGIRIWCGQDFAICGENIAGIMYIAAIFAKYFSTILCEKKIKNVYQLVGEKWHTITDPDERRILRAYAKESKYIEKVYIAYICVAAVAFSQSCMINTILDIVYPLNESRPKLLPVKGEFFFDPYEHHFKIYLIYCIATIVSAVTLLGIDVMYVAVVHQCLATINVVQHRLTKASNFYVNDKVLGYRTIISAIRMHKDALKFLDVIDSSYGICLLLIVSLTGVFLSLGVVVILENLDSPIECMKCAIFEVGVVIHLFYLSWPGQKVLDHSSNLLFHIYSCNWYNMDKQGKFLIRIMMLRCSKLAKLTACGMYIMSFENYATVIKTTLSYTAVATSLRE